VVPEVKIQLGEEACAKEFVEELIDHWDGVGILHGDGVRAR